MKIAIGVVVVSLTALLIWANWPIAPLPDGVVVDRVLINKSGRTLSLMSNGEVVRDYSVSLGSVPLGAKEREGDQKTPEGIYRITEHYSKSSFHRSLRLSYPNPNDIERARRSGFDPGSDIMIHGMRNRLGLVGRMHLWFDWTAGCVAVTDQEIDQIWDAVQDGTIVEIVP